MYERLMVDGFSAGLPSSTVQCELPTLLTEYIAGPCRNTAAKHPTAVRPCVQVLPQSIALPSSSLVLAESQQGSSYVLVI